MITVTRSAAKDPLKQEAMSEIERYLGRFPGEAPGLARLLEQARQAGDLFARSNMAGHVTTSALVLNHKHTHILLVHHKHHDLWLQPGGHYEGNGPLLESAMREVTEETGVSEAEPHPSFRSPTTPFDIDSHPITARPEKKEGPHWHHDFIYLMIADASQNALTPQIEEVHGARWFPLSDVATLGNPRMLRMAEKLKAL